MSPLCVFLHPASRDNVRRRPTLPAPSSNAHAAAVSAVRRATAPDCNCTCHCRSELYEYGWVATQSEPSDPFSTKLQYHTDLPTPTVDFPDVQILISLGLLPLLFTPEPLVQFVAHELGIRFFLHIYLLTRTP